MKKNTFVAILSIFGVVLFFAGSIKAQQQTVTFPCLGFPQYFSVPPGVTQIIAEIVGSDGNGTDEIRSSFGEAEGGKGAKLTSNINVTPGEILTVYSGCATGYGFTRGGRAQIYAKRVFDLYSWSGIAGGGSSAILKQSTVLAVAGGGGSAGTTSFFAVSGGKGGDAIPASGNGDDGLGIEPGGGGIFGGGGSANGDGSDGTVNSTRIGGGGGGGAGYDPNGGGGGSSGIGAGSGSGGGGGGGKSYTNPLFVSSSNLELFPGVNVESGYVKITYNGPANGHLTENCSQTSKTYTVPSQVRSLIITGIGGDGGGLSKLTKSSLLYSVTTNSIGLGLDNFANLSGAARAFRTQIPVVPGEQLQIGVGCQGVLSTIGNPLDNANPGGPGGFGYIFGGKGGDGDKPPLLLNYGVGGVGGGGATGIGRSAGTPLFIAPGGGGGGGVGGAYIFGCNGGEGGVGGGRNGGDASPCANNGRGGLTGGGLTSGGNACSFCTSGGGGGGGGGYLSGRGGTAGLIGSAGGGGGGGGAFYVTPGSVNIQNFDPTEYRRVNSYNDPFWSFNDDGEPMKAKNGVLSITPVYTDLAPPVITPSVSPIEPNGDNGWYRSNVNIAWQVTSDSPITSQTGCQSLVLTTDTNAFNSSCSATNSVGTTSGSIPTIKRDATLPNITATAVQQGGTPYVYGTITSLPVTVTFNCSDATSGVASCPEPQTFGSNATVTGTVRDNAGNSRTVTFGNVVSDNQPPTISVINDRETPVNTTINSVPFTISDAETTASQLVVRFSSSNENVVSNSLITLLTDSQNPTNRALEIIPVLNKVGTTIITVDVFDAKSARATRTFLVSVKCGTITIQQPSSVIYGAYLDAPLFPTGGVAPYTFNQVSGVLPGNLEFDPEFNRLVGGPVRAFAPSTRNLQFTVTDANGCSNPVPVTVNVACQINPIVSQASDSEVFSLRGWVEGACPNSTITFDGFLNNQELSLFGTLNIQKPLTIQGPGADKLTLKNVLPSGNDSTVVAISAVDGEMTISGVTIKDGIAPNSSGGGIRSFANLTVRDSVITGNFASRGGGIALLLNDKTLNVINTTVSGNTATNGNDNNGGGIMSNGALNLINSTVSGNTVFSGFNGAAGIFALSGLISNSTITNNLVNDSFQSSSNMASGVFGGSANLFVSSSIIAANQNSNTFPFSFPDVRNLFTSNGYNLIGNRGAVTAFSQTGDQTGANPMLDVLRFNGGTTPTHSFLSMASPAIDKGKAGSFNFADDLLPPITTDQRGVSRPYDNPNIPNAAGGDGSDIGAFEIAAPTAANISVAGRISNKNGRGIYRAQIIMTMPNGETRTAQSNQFGYFRFDEIQVGETYIFAVQHKQYNFNTQVINIYDALDDLNFTANSEQ